MIFLGECVPAWWYEDVLDMRDDVLCPESVFVLGVCLVADIEAWDIHGSCFDGVCGEWECFYGEAAVVIAAGFHFDFCDDWECLVDSDAVGACAYEE